MKMMGTIFKDYAESISDTEGPDSGSVQNRAMWNLPYGIVGNRPFAAVGVSDRNADKSTIRHGLPNVGKAEEFKSSRFLFRPMCGCFANIIGDFHCSPRLKAQQHALKDCLESDGVAY